MTTEQQRNVERILQKARILSDATKAEALKRGDHETAMRIASNEGKVDDYFEKEGCRRAFIVKPDGTILT